MGLAPILRYFERETGAFNEITMFCMLCCGGTRHWFACSLAVFFSLAQRTIQIIFAVIEPPCVVLAELTIYTW